MKSKALKPVLVFTWMAGAGALSAAPLGGKNFGVGSEHVLTPAADASAWLLIILLFGLLGSFGLFARYLYVQSKVKTPERELMEELMPQYQPPEQLSPQPPPREKKEPWEKSPEWWKNV